LLDISADLSSLITPDSCNQAPSARSQTRNQKFVKWRYLSSYRHGRPIFPTTSSASPVLVILAASDPTNTVVHCWRSCVSGGWKPPLQQSAARRHVSFNADSFQEPPQNSYLIPIIAFLTVCGF